MRVGGWQRIGIILSVAWAVAGPIYLNDRALTNALKEAAHTYHDCREFQVPGDDPARCTERSNAMLKIGMRNVASIGSLGWAVVATTPVAVLWPPRSGRDAVRRNPAALTQGAQGPVKAPACWNGCYFVTGKWRRDFNRDNARNADVIRIFKGSEADDS
jgi:hypothetical protein